ncbi:ribosome silencing factor [Rivibacter subsaxonicus]|uniref:Ribosomal silencing factor RsfS n=1 Tax=Rivibacter subsaxonicus TaxID=457575 RepID=A0A4V2FUR1_9BURK|nr:ribosome silencing factor [Rivibacter subsaxonicus]RZU03026.1 ribosome-associated protein [Rivibacter subsaxonicus]
MDIRKLQRAIVDGLEDVKAQDIVVLNTEHLSPLFERVIIASGTSNRQTKALAASVRDAVRSGGMTVMRTEGEVNGEWIIVDCGAAVAHIMQPAIRQYYHLEEIWGGKPVKMKLDDSAHGLVKASEPIDEEALPAARKAAGKKMPANKGPHTRLGAKKAPARKVVPAKKAAAGTAVAKKVAAKKRAADTANSLQSTRKSAEKASNQAGSKPAAKPAAAKKPAAKKVATKRPAAKAPARRAT